MIRVRVFALALAVTCIPSYGADWSDTAFPIKSHNFGTVAVAAKTEFRFPIHNSFSNMMHIRSVRASCGCTTPIIESQYINPNQTGSLVARFNTDTFRGKRGATVTVVIDQPFYSEVRLRVDGYIRSDMVFHPGAIEFGKLNQGEAVSKSTKIYYAGRESWKIADVLSNRPWLTPSFNEVSRGGGRVTYEITAGVSAEAPVGFFQDELVVVTDDRSMPRVPLRISGQVDSALTISPQAIALGSLKPGQTISQKLVVIGREPFTIASINADGWDIKFAESAESKRTHVLFVELTPTEITAGAKKSAIEITTTGNQSVTAKALLTADIRDR